LNSSDFYSELVKVEGQRVKEISISLTLPLLPRLGARSLLSRKGFQEHRFLFNRLFVKVRGKVKGKGGKVRKCLSPMTRNPSTEPKGLLQKV
jgi:hypothetical protein